MSNIQTKLVTRVRNGPEHEMIRSIVANVFREQTEKIEKISRNLTIDELLEVSLIYQRLIQLKLIHSAGVLKLDSPQNLYAENVLKDVLINYDTKQSLSSVFKRKIGVELPETTSKTLTKKENEPIKPLFTSTDINNFREKTNQEMVESRKQLNLRKPFTEDEQVDEEDDDEHSIDDDREVTDDEKNDEHDEEYHTRSEESDDTITTRSSSEEEVTTGWTKTLLSSKSKSNQLLESTPTKNASPALPPLSLQRLPPIIRPPTTSSLQFKDESPSSTDSELLPDKKESTVIKREIDPEPEEDGSHDADGTCADLEELKFDDLPGDFSDSGGSISF